LVAIRDGGAALDASASASASSLALAVLCLALRLALSSVLASPFFQVGVSLSRASALFDGDAGFCGSSSLVFTAWLLPWL